jgi:dienelactone hydrolase
MKHPDIQPANTLWPWYQPEAAPHAFRAKDMQSAQDWQARARSALAETFGLARFGRVPFDARTVERIDRGTFVREKILLRTGPQTLMPVYILHPKHVSKPATVLAFAGHGYGVADIIGRWEDGSERTVPDGYHRDFGVALCHAGFTVVAPEITCFGERTTDFAHLNRAMGQQEPNPCHHTAMLAFHLGSSVPAMRVHDAIRLVDYLETRADIDTDRLGAMGISGGGMHTLFSAAVDTRIKAMVISGYVSNWRESIFAMHHCACNVVPGMAAHGEMTDLLALLAPRPLLIESGVQDPIFPIASVRSATQQTMAHYAVFGASQQVETDFFEGRHEIHGTAAYPFLARVLR